MARMLQSTANKFAAAGSSTSSSNTSSVKPNTGSVGDSNSSSGSSSSVPQTTSNNADLASVQKKLQATPQYAAEVAKSSSSASSKPQVSTTTLSTGNKMDQVVKNNVQLDKLADKKPQTDAEGVLRYSDGSIYEGDIVKPDTKAEDDTINSTLEAMKGNADADLRRQLDSIQSRAEQLKRQQAEINQRAMRSTQTGLLQSGAYGGGSQARSDTTGSAGILMSQESYGLSKIAAINAQEDDAIAKSYQAKADGDYRRMEQYLALAKEKRAEKITKAAEVNKMLADKAEKAAEMNLQSQKDTAISELFSQGVTDVPNILAHLEELGVPATAKEVQDTLKIINPSEDLAGLSADYRTYVALQKAGDPSVQGLSWLQYQAAVTNATNKKIATVTKSGGGSSGGGKITGGGSSVSSTTKAIIDNPSLFDDLTPTVRGQVIQELQANGFNTTNLGVKALSDTAIQTIAQSQSAVSNLQALRKTVAENMDKIGPITGLAALNPYSESQKIQAQVDKVRQVVGKALEGGVLRKEDEDKYKKILATITDTPETALYKIDALTTSIQRDIENYKNLQQSGGRSVDVNAPLVQKGKEVTPEDLRAKYKY